MGIRLLAPYARFCLFFSSLCRSATSTFLVVDMRQEKEEEQEQEKLKLPLPQLDNISALYLSVNND